MIFAENKLTEVNVHNKVEQFYIEHVKWCEHIILDYSWKLLYLMEPEENLLQV